MNMGLFRFYLNTQFNQLSRGSQKTLKSLGEKVAKEILGKKFDKEEYRFVVCVVINTYILKKPLECNTGNRFLTVLPQNYFSVGNNDIRKRKQQSDIQSGGAK